jgi:GT2 family glycosyltransferase
MTPSFLKKLRHYVKFRLSVEAFPIQKTYEQWAAKGYNQAPVISFIIQCHNRSKSVSEVVLQLRTFKGGEIIVLDDGSELSHTRTLSRFLTGANEFLIRSNDLYEIISYDRAIHFSRGTYVALLQDDDGFEDIRWIQDAITLFEKHPKLAILGGKNGIKFLPPDLTEDGLPGPWEYDGDIFKQSNVCKGVHVASAGRDHSFRFVQSVNRAPMLLNKALFESILHHIDQSYAPVLWDDAELCLRAWLSGLEVGWYPVEVQTSGYGKGGTRIWNNQLIERQNVVNGKRLYERYGQELGRLEQLVEKANWGLNSSKTSGHDNN